MIHKSPFIAFAALAVGLAGFHAQTHAAGREPEDKIPEIVDEAKVVKEGTGRIEYTAREKGQVWLYDVEDRQAKHSISVSPGDRYSIDPREDRVYFNDRDAAKVSLDNDHRYRIYYVTAEERDARHDRSDEKRKDAKESRKPEKARVPDTAQMVAEGRDKDLTVELNRAGTIYLWDHSNNEVINTFNVNKGQTLVVSPGNNTVTLDGKRVRADDLELNRRVHYRLLFDEDRNN